MKYILSIVHGAKRIKQTKNFVPLWPKKMKTHMMRLGIDHVEVFYWSGGVIDLLCPHVAKRYAEHISKLYQNVNQNESIKLCIIAKSLGAIIAEKGLSILDHEVKSPVTVNRFLRIATPDYRNYLKIPNIDYVKDVISNSDMFYKFSRPLLVLPIYYLFSNNDGENKYIECIRFSALSHGDFNNNIMINRGSSFKGRLYDYYHNLLFV